jgi:DNA-binding CsgD family transcriptional regulator
MIDHPAKEVVYDSLLITEQEMNRDPVYDWFGRHGLRYFIGAALPPTSSHLVVFTLQRSPDQGHVQVDDLRLFGQVKAHLGRAISLAERLGTLSAFGRFSSALLEGFPQAIFALDARGQVCFANVAAGTLLRNCDGLSLADGRLRAALAAEQHALDALIADSIAGGDRGMSGWTRISRTNRKPPYVVLIAPLNVDDNELASAAARVMVIIHDLTKRTAIDPQTLSDIFGLTNTEARLASAIAAGHSLESAAISLGMQVATARTHLKAIFTKLQVNRQQDLVRLLTNLASITP